MGEHGVAPAWPLLSPPPLLAVIVDGEIRQVAGSAGRTLVLWQALWTVAHCVVAGVLCEALTMTPRWSSRELRARAEMLAGQALEMSGMLILAMPGSVGHRSSLLLNNTIGLPQSADGIVIFTNALMAIPYAESTGKPMGDITARYSRLCQSLGIEGWSRLKVVELRALKRPLAQRGFCLRAVDW